MNPEHDRKQKQVNLWLGQFIMNAIDEALRTKRLEGWENSEKHCIKVIDIIMAPLINGRVPIETLERLKVEFVSPKGEAEITEQINEDLQHVEEDLAAEFGNGVVRRLKLSLNQYKIRDIPPC
jgi:hypothetical protein